jgi:hypothetical protein
VSYRQHSFLSVPLPSTACFFIPKLAVVKDTMFLLSPPAQMSRAAGPGNHWPSVKPRLRAVGYRGNIVDPWLAGMGCN